MPCKQDETYVVLSLHLHQFFLYIVYYAELVQQGLLETAMKCLTTHISTVPKRIIVLPLMGKHLLFLAAVNLTGRVWQDWHLKNKWQENLTLSCLKEEGKQLLVEGISWATPAERTYRKEWNRSNDHLRMRYGASEKRQLMPGLDKTLIEREFLITK